MSSFTSLGVNKNKKVFAPKPKKAVRKSKSSSSNINKKPTIVDESALSSELPTITSHSVPFLSTDETPTSVTFSKSSSLNETRTSNAPSTTNNISQNLAQDDVEMDEENQEASKMKILTTEEMGLNAQTTQASSKPKPKPKSAVTSSANTIPPTIQKTVTSNINISNTPVDTHKGKRKQPDSVKNNHTIKPPSSPAVAADSPIAPPQEDDMQIKESSSAATTPIDMKRERTTPHLYAKNEASSNQRAIDSSAEPESEADQTHTLASDISNSERHSPTPPPRPTKRRKSAIQPKKPATATTSSAAPASSKNKGKQKETAKSTTRSGTQSKPAAVSFGAPSTHQTPVEPSTQAIATRTTSEQEKQRPHGSLADRWAYTLPENMKTLEDISHDPVNHDYLEKPMKLFTKDMDGIVSKAFKDMEIIRFAQKRKEEQQSRLSVEELETAKQKEADEQENAARRKLEKQKEEEERRKREQKNRGSVLPESSNALQVRMVDGQIVLDTDSLTIERGQGGMLDDRDENMEVVEENSMTRKVNSHTFGKRRSAKRWDELETANFFNLLSQFGTDFEMISAMMPGRDRGQIRLKFNREERANPEKVTDYLISKRKPVDLEKFKQVTGIEDFAPVPVDFHEMQIV